MKIILLMATTLDGKIAKHADHLANWTSKADKKVFVEETKKAGVMVMGRATYNTIGRPLPGRLTVVMTREPDNSKNMPGSLEYTDAPPRQIIADLEKRDFKTVMICGGAIINGLFLNEKLIDEVWLTIEPKLFGEGLSLFKGADVDVNLRLKQIIPLDENVIHVRYDIVY